MTETNEYISDRLSVVEHVDIAGMLGDTISRLLALSTEAPTRARRQIGELTKGLGGGLDVLANKREQARQKAHSQYHRRLGRFKTDCLFLVGSVQRFETALEEFSRKDIRRWCWSLMSYRLLLDRFLDALLAERQQGHEYQRLLDRTAESRGGDDFVTRALVEYYAGVARRALTLPHWHRQWSVQRLGRVLDWADGNRAKVRLQLDTARDRAAKCDVDLIKRLSASTSSEPGLLIAFLRTLKTSELVKEMNDRRQMLTGVRNRLEHLQAMCTRTTAGADDMTDPTKGGADGQRGLAQKNDEPAAGSGT